MSDQIWQMSEQNQILIGHNVRPNKIYCLIEIAGTPQSRFILIDQCFLLAASVVLSF